MRERSYNSLGRRDNLAHTIGDDSAGCSLGRAVLGIAAQTTLGKGSPEGASVNSAGQVLVGVENSITSLDEVRVAWLPVIFS
jgi:hypothetical protein